MFSKILIANRGEIACRVIDTATRLGVATVAVYSDADAHALHVELADEAMHIGAAPARDSYLRGERIIDCALRSGAQAVHPGYGFLSENAEFASACASAGLVFIGPPPEAISAMGSKSAAKQIMGDAGVPLIPGYHGEDQSEQQLRAEADAIGYPVLLKATAGGGGKGMRVVNAPAEFADALAAAKREAQASFADDRMLVEKYLTKPRHVEVQVFCDNHGGAVYLAERDCSVQRRHQKVLEEAPAPGMTPALREAMGSTAIEAARAIDYRGAGTVEFLLDADGSFFFMEMNTRLQVEHPVTEMITGLDLVHWQLLVASGEPLPLQQHQVTLSGHAFEARIYAENPEQDFLPAAGHVSYLCPPAESAHVRVDSGIRSGDDITPFYDPMIAKLIVWDESRDRALNRLTGALRDYRIAGTVTNLDFLFNLANSAAFRAADIDTGFIARHHDELFPSRNHLAAADVALAATSLVLLRRQRARPRPDTDPFSPWSAVNGWRLNESLQHRLVVHSHGADHAVTVRERADSFVVDAGGNVITLRASLDGETLDIELQGHRQRATLAAAQPGWTLFLNDRACHFHQVMPDLGEANAGAGGGLQAPMNGTVIALMVEPGASVEAGTPLLILEAMKMEHTVRAPQAGTVKAFYFKAGDLVDGGVTLVDFAADEA